MEKTFQEVMNTIKEGETWINKYDDRRLAKIEKSSNVIHFKFNGEFEKIGVMLDDIFVLGKKKYTSEEAMKALKEGKEIESCASKTRYKISPNGKNYVSYYDTEYNQWLIEFRMFECTEIFGEWYINN